MYLLQSILRNHSSNSLNPIENQNNVEEININWVEQKNMDPIEKIIQVSSRWGYQTNKNCILDRFIDTSRDFTINFTKLILSYYLYGFPLSQNIKTEKSTIRCFGQQHDDMLIISYFLWESHSNPSWAFISFT